MQWKTSGFLLDEFYANYSDDKTINYEWFYGFVIDEFHIWMSESN